MGDGDRLKPISPTGCGAPPPMPVPSPTGACKNVWSQKKCANWKKNNKCNKDQAKKNCQLTCDHCDGSTSPSPVPSPQPSPSTCKNSLGVKKCNRLKKKNGC